MHRDAASAKALLNSGSYTCVLVKEDAIYTATERGVKPLLRWLEQKVDLSGYSAADKVVGKAAAFLYILLDVHAVHASVISHSALDLLNANGIIVSYDVLVEAIRNRSNTGNCPMEHATKDITDPVEALYTIQATLAQLQQT